MNERPVLSQSVIDSIKAQIAVLDESGVIIAVNRAWREVGEGAAARDSVGTNYLDVCRAAAPKDAFANAAIRALEEVLHNRAAHVAIEYPCAMPDGEHWFLMDVTSLAEGSGAVVSHTDITQRVLYANAVQASEARYRHLFERNVAGVVSCTFDDGTVLEANSAFAQLMGHSPSHDLRGESLANYADLETWETLRALLHENGVFASMEAEVHPVSGADRWLIVSAMRIVDAGRSVIHATCMDITNAKEADRHLRESKRELELAVETRTAELRALTAQLMRVQEDERSRIARDIHDEFGQSLTELNLGIATLKSISDPRELDQRINELGELTRRTAQSVQRLASDLRPPLLDRLGLVAALEARVDQLRSRANVQAALSVEPPNITVHGDCATAIFRIVQEALTNVVRHARASRVTVRLRETPRGITLVVRDNGGGIPAQRVSGAESLGLAGMRERARMIGGRLRIRGVAGCGTIVRLDLPNDCPEVS